MDQKTISTINMDIISNNVSYLMVFVGDEKSFNFELNETIGYQRWSGSFDKEDVKNINPIWCIFPTTYDIANCISSEFSQNHFKLNHFENNFVLQFDVVDKIGPTEIRLELKLPLNLQSKPNIEEIVHRLFSQQVQKSKFLENSLQNIEKRLSIVENNQNDQCKSSTNYNKAEIQKIKKSLKSLSEKIPKKQSRIKRKYNNYNRNVKAEGRRRILGKFAKKTNIEQGLNLEGPIPNSQTVPIPKIDRKFINIDPEYHELKDLGKYVKKIGGDDNLSIVKISGEILSTGISYFNLKGYSVCKNFYKHLQFGFAKFNIDNSSHICRIFSLDNKKKWQLNFNDIRHLEIAINMDSNEINVYNSEGQKIFNDKFDLLPEEKENLFPCIWLRYVGHRATLLD